MSPQQDSRQRKRIALALFFFCQGLGFASWASRIPIIKSKLDISEASLGTILIMMPLAQLITMTISGRLVSRFGSRKVLRIACLCYGLVLIGIAYVQTPIQLGAALFLFGIFGNMSNISVNTQGVEVEKLYGKSIMASFHGAWSIGGFTGALLGIIFMNLGFDTATHFIIIFFLILCNTLINQGHIVRGIPVAHEAAKRFEKPDAMLIQLGILGFLSMATEGAMFDWTGVYFKEVIKAPERWISLGYAAFMVMMATGRFVGDKIIGKLGRLRTLQLSGILMLSGMLVSALFPEMIVCTMAFMIVGIGVSCVVPTVYSLTGTHQRISPGRALALVSSISYLGFLLGPPLIGYIAELWSLRISFAVFASFGLILYFIVGKLKIVKG